MKTCLARGRLERLLENRLGDTELDELEQHVEGCTACQQVPGTARQNEYIITMNRLIYNWNPSFASVRGVRQSAGVCPLGGPWQGRPVVP